MTTGWSRCKWLIGCWLALASLSGAEPTLRPNFLFIAVDDLNDFCGYAAEEPGNYLQTIYPDSKLRAAVIARLTPNLNELAAHSTPFMRAYCASPLCGPSRTALLTGIRPHQSGYYQHDRNFRLNPRLKDVVTLPQHLKANGYFTTGVGKIFHTGQGSPQGPVKDDWADARNSWSQWTNHPLGCNGGEPSRYSPPDGGLMQFGPSRLRLEQSGDFQAANFIAQVLEARTATTTAKRGAAPQTVSLPAGQPFFVACGLFRPHLPFHVPSEYFDRFPVQEMSGLTRVELERIVADLDDLPRGARRFTDLRRGKMHEVLARGNDIAGAEGEIAAWRATVQAYLACVSFADDCLGRLLEAWRQSPEHSNTVLVLWSDHGWHLGAKHHFAKQALWEEANRVQMVICDPRNPHTQTGAPRRQIVSLCDMYPTLCELAGIAPPPQGAGTSLVPLLNNPGGAELHDSVLMTYQRGNHALRTPAHRYIRYADGSEELYDMAADPQQTINLANSPTHAAKRSELMKQLAQVVAEEARRSRDDP